VQVPGALEMMILQTLRREPLHGYALVQHIKRASNDLLQVEEGSLYPGSPRATGSCRSSSETRATHRTRRRCRIRPSSISAAPRLR
jgi:PadR family transcriptional regulator